jgi:hypothetical protein
LKNRDLASSPRAGLEGKANFDVVTSQSGPDSFAEVNRVSSNLKSNGADYNSQTHFTSGKARPASYARNANSGNSKSGLASLPAGIERRSMALPAIDHGRQKQKLQSILNLCESNATGEQDQTKAFPGSSGTRSGLQFKQPSPFGSAKMRPNNFMRNGSNPNLGQRASKTNLANIDEESKTVPGGNKLLNKQRKRLASHQG